MLANQHDSLRITFNNNIQRYNKKIALPKLHIIDISDQSSDSIQEKLTSLQNRFNIEDRTIMEYSLPSWIRRRKCKNFLCSSPLNS